MSGLRTRWRASGDPARFRATTFGSFELGLLLAGVLISVQLPAGWWLLGVVAATGAGMLSLAAREALAGGLAGRLSPWGVPLATVVLVSVALVCAVVVRRAEGDASERYGAELGLFSATVLVLTVVPFARRRWWVAVAVGLLCGLGFATHLSDAWRLALGMTFLAVILVGACRSTLWSLQVVDDLDRTRAVEAELRVADERLRFARDLHDVVGRAFSAVAVKSELASTLARAGSADRAAREMDEVRALAVDSMEQMRVVVRGYREIDLAEEVAGARSLLAATGCDLAVEGAASAVPAPFHEAAAWFVREATTNVVKHSSARHATLTLGSSGISLRNDGVREGGASRTAGTPRSGLQGLSERLSAVGATLRVSREADDFVVEARWTSS